MGYTGVNAVSFMTNAIDTSTRGVDLTSSYRMQLHQSGTLTVTGSANDNKTDIDRIAPTPAALTALGITTPLFDPLR